MSFNTVDALKETGFMVDVSTSDRRESFIGYPPMPAYGLGSSQAPKWEVGRLFSPVAPLLSQAAHSGTDAIYNMLSTLSSDLYSDAFGLKNRQTAHELANPYSLYTWETSVHTISLLMKRLLSTQQLELALKVARLLFDPAKVGPDGDVTACWNFIPFRDPNLQNSTGSSASTVQSRIDLHDWNAHQANVHSVARARPVAYMKRIVIKYIEILIALGDQLFRQGTLETIPLALQRYIEASHLFGPRPVVVPRLGKRTALSYNDLLAKAMELDDLSNAELQLELEFPFRTDLLSSSSSNIPPLVQTGYFCIPANPEMASLRALLDDRLFKCRNNLDINGHGQSLPLFEPPIDPGNLIRAISSSSPTETPASIVASDLASPMPRYRCFYLLERALDLVRELNDMDSRILLAKERKDAAALASLSAKHSTAIHNLIVQVKQARIDEELASIKTLQETRRSHVQRLGCYLSLVGDPPPPPCGR